MRNILKAPLAILAIAFALITFAFLAGCDKPSGPAKINVMLSWYPGAENAFLYYGLEKGIFKKYGIELEIQPSKGSSIVASALVNDKINFGFISSDYLITTVGGGNNLKALFTLYHESPVTIYSLADRNIKKPEDLNGKILAVLAKSAAYPQVINFLKLKGVKLSEEVSGTGSFTDLTGGKADAAMDYTHYAPVTLEVKSGNKPNEIRIADYYKNFYGTSIVASAKLIGSNPKFVGKFICAMVESLDASLKDEAGSVDALVHANPSLEKDVMIAAVRKLNAMILRNTDKLGIAHMTLDGWTSTKDAVESLGSIKLSKFDVNNVFDSSFLENARNGSCNKI